jgi:hypothetical protein
MGLLKMLFGRREAEIQAMNPYVLAPFQDIHWVRWSVLPALEEIGSLPKRKGLPVLMTQTECEIANGGGLPQYWGDVPYAWRTEEQKQAFYARDPESFKPPARPYVDEGVALTKKLIGVLHLSDWQTGVPDYTELEMRAMHRALRSFPKNADQRMSASRALHGLAGRGWEVSDDCPDDWKVRVSTYLKAWAMQLDPLVLLDMSRMLALAGYRDEARDAAAIVATGFPTYAPRFFAGAADPQRVEAITRSAREIMQEINGQRAPEPSVDPNLPGCPTEWEQRVSKVVREKPNVHCPDCGSDHVIFYFYFMPSPEERHATEPYQDFIQFGWRTCSPPALSSRKLLESWTCRQCGEIWDEVFDRKQKASIDS